MELPKITTKQQQIPRLLYRFRFLDRTHIQHFLHHKDKQQVNRWLKDLTEKEYLLRIYDNTIIGKNRKPAVYSLGLNGIRFLKSTDVVDKTSLHKLYFEKDRSETFIEHCLLIATICCQLEKKKDDTLEYQYSAEADYSDTDNPFHFLKDSELPVDLCFSKKQKGKGLQFYLLTAFDSTLPKYRIRKRIRDYYDFYTSNEWENKMRAIFPTLLFVFQKKELIIYTKRYIKAMLEGNRTSDLRINFGLVHDLLVEGITGEIWEYRN